MHTAQQTDDVKILLGKVSTTFTNVMTVITSRVQPLDVVINKPFKNHIRKDFERHSEENLDLYVEGSFQHQKDECLPPSGLQTRAKIKQDKEMIRHSFLKCGLSNSFDGSKDHEVNIKGIDGYKMPETESEFHMVSESEDEETDIEFETESRDNESRGSESSDEDDV